MRVLIVGGGIGGFALAISLHQRGIEALVVERAPAFKALGHFIALKTEGVRVLDRLGITAPCRAAGLPPSTHLRVTTAGGRLLREQDLSVFQTALHGYLMMRRSDLSAALHAAATPYTEVRYGTEVTALEQDDCGVLATLSTGGQERFDVVVGCDGVHSRTRGLLFGQAGPRPLGGSYIALDVHSEHRLPAGQMSLYLGRGQLVGLLPGSPDRVSGIVYHAGTELRAQLHDARGARRFFAREYAGFHADVRDVFASIDDADFVFVDNIVQIDLPEIVTGRAALLGDAAACPTFLSGMGSAYAMLSAENLAGELARGDDPSAALARYGASANAMSRELKGNALRMARVILNRSPVTAALRDTVLQLFPETLLMARAQQFYQTHPNA